MKIGVIGAGHMASALTEHLVRKGHEVMLSNSRGPESLKMLATSLRCRAGTPEEAAAFGDIVAIAIPLHALKNVPVQPLRGKTIIDLVNYYPNRDGAMPELDAGQTTTSEMLARHLHSSHVVKAFNAIMVSDLREHGKPSGTPGRRALPIAGDDPISKQRVSAMVDDCGFDPLDVGPLAEGWRFERARPAYCIPLERAALAEWLANTTRNAMVPEGSWHRHSKSEME